MNTRTGIIVAGLWLVLLVLPPLPGYGLNQLGISVGVSDAAEPLWRSMFDPLRVLGALLAVGWVLTMARLPRRSSLVFRYAMVFLIGGVLYALPPWIAMIGSDPPWAAVLWLIPIATVSEWGEVHAPLAGLLCMGAFHLLPAVQPPTPVRFGERMMDRYHAFRGR